MTAPTPMPGGQADPNDASSLSEEFEVFVTEVLPDGVLEVIEAVHELTASPLDIAKEHMDEVGELQMQSVEALMNNDPDTAQALLAQADQKMSEAADVLDPSD